MSSVGCSKCEMRSHIPFGLTAAMMASYCFKLSDHFFRLMTLCRLTYWFYFMVWLRICGLGTWWYNSSSNYPYSMTDELNLLGNFFDCT